MERIVYFIFTLPFLFTVLSCQSAHQKTDEAENSVSIHTDFEGGSLGAIEQVSDYHWRCAVEGESDAEGRNRQTTWYYFRLEGAKGQKVTFELTELMGEYNYKPNKYFVTPETRPVISYNQQDWQHLTDQEVSWNEAATELILSFTPEADTVWLAHQTPYTHTRLVEFLSQFENHPYLQKEVIGKTPEGRDMLLLTLAKDEIPESDKKQVWIMARQHSWEAGSSWVMEGAIRHLLSSPKADSLLAKVSYHLIPMADPDGVARGGVRYNAYGHDLNRNWDLVLPDEMPEIQAQKAAISTHAGQIDLFITLHNTEKADYIRGPDLPVGDKLWQAMVDQTSFESDEGVRKMVRTTTEGMEGRMSVNQALWDEYQIPAYLMELKVEHNEKLSGRRLAPDWLEMGGGLVEASFHAVQ